MLRRNSWGTLVLILALAGCQKSASDPKPAAASPSDGNRSTATSADRQNDPKQVVHQFLAALFAGDGAQATRLLTDKARQAAASAQLELKPPGSEGAKYEVTEVAILEDDPTEAHVWSTVRDTNEAGEEEAYDIVWLLRKQPAGWAVYGMATTLFEENLPLLLNFEDPRDVVAKREWARSEYERRMQQAARPDSQPTQR